ncbi:hypothetical protein GGF31_004439 [Allomyces arbusculus]|nr:hypothetical protein GGF31_004439 [Allomyces arbusculus]
MAGIKLLPDLLAHQKSVDSKVLETAELRMEIAEQKVSIAAAVEEAENENRDPNMDNKVRQLRQSNHNLQTHLCNTKHEYNQGVIEYHVLTVLANIQQEMAGIKGNIAALTSDVTAVKGSIAALTSDVATVKAGITALQRQQVGIQIMAWNMLAHKQNMKSWVKYHRPQGQRSSRGDLLAPLLPVHPDPVVLARARGNLTFEDMHSAKNWMTIHPAFSISDTSLVCVPPKIAFHGPHKLFPRTVSDLLLLGLADLMELEAIYEEQFVPGPDLTGNHVSLSPGGATLPPATGASTSVTPPPAATSATPPPAAEAASNARRNPRRLAMNARDAANDRTSAGVSTAAHERADQQVTDTINMRGRLSFFAFITGKPALE